MNHMNQSDHLLGSSESEDDTIRVLIDEIVKIKTLIEELQNSEKALKEELIKYMEYYDIYDYQSDNAEVLYIKSSTYKRIDTNRLKTEQPEIYESYTVDTKRDPYIRVKML